VEARLGGREKTLGGELVEGGGEEGEPGRMRIVETGTRAAVTDRLLPSPPVAPVSNAALVSSRGLSITSHIELEIVKKGIGEEGDL
jgi:hypothetical protein